MVRSVIYAVCMSLLILVSAVHAQIPQTMSYQGILTDGSGVNVPDGNYNLTFKLYDVASGPNPALWNESQLVQVNKGVFNVMLGSSSVLNLPFDKPYWLGISVALNPELTPRVALASSPYSLNTKSIVNGQVVKSLNGLTDAVTLVGAGGATVTTSGNTITLTASGGGTGILGVQNTNSTLDITNGTGPTATINVRNQGITTAQLADNAVTGAKIASGQVVKSINSLRDDVTLTAGTNVTITPSGDELTISATGGSSGLSAVSHDTTLRGDGTSGNPLSVSKSGVDSTKLGTNSVNSEKILNYSIRSEDLSPSLRAPNADSINGIPASRLQTANQLFPLDSDGGLTFEFNQQNIISRDQVNVSGGPLISTNAKIGVKAGIKFGAPFFPVIGPLIKSLNELIEGIGIEGEGGKVGVLGKSSRVGIHGIGDGVGVRGESSNIGVFGSSQSGLAGYFDNNVEIAGNAKISGSVNGRTWWAGNGIGINILSSDEYGIIGKTTGANMAGVKGDGGTSAYGVDGTTTGIDKAGVRGNGGSNSYGVIGFNTNPIEYAAIFGRNDATSCWGALGHKKYGVYGNAKTNPGGFAGYFDGDVKVEAASFEVSLFGVNGKNAITATNEGNYSAVFGKNTGTGPGIRGESQQSGYYAALGTTSYGLDVSGPARCTSGIWISSDKRYKKDIKPLRDALNNVLNLEGVHYYWRKDEFPKLNFSDDLQLGFIAQQVEKIYPELVNTDPDGYKSMEYTKLTPILVEAIKEQQQMITELNDANAHVVSELRLMKDEINTLKKLVYESHTTATEKLTASK